jgi:hypothetical protein
VSDVSTIVEQARLEADRVWGRQHERAKMFRSLELRAHGALATICKERLEGPHETHDASYLDFFTKLVERLEAGAKRVNGIIEDECRDLLFQAATRIFSHLLRTDPNFDFDRVIAPVPEELPDSLGKAVEDYVDALLVKFSHGSIESSSGLEGDDGEGDDGDGGDAVTS